MGKFKLNATYGWLINAYKNRASQHVYALSEFIDNSMASYSKDIKGIKKENKLDVNGLVIKIDIVKNNDQMQYIKIFDNAGGMSEKVFENAMQPGNTKGKTHADLNQFGVGMKFGIFWLGSSVEIHTKENQGKEYYLHLEINNENEDKEAIVDIKKTIDKTIDENGTWIKINDIYENRMFKNRIDVDLLRESLGWRYGGLLRHCGMKIIVKFTDLENHRSTDDSASCVVPYLPTPYQLNDVAQVLSTTRKSDFNKEKFINDLLKGVKTRYEKRKDDIKLITGNKDFYETLKTNGELFFVFKDTIEGVHVDIKWGILHSKHKGNNKYGFQDLNGFTLIHKNRAIYHGPNANKDKSSVSSVRMGNYPFSAGGKTSSKIRLYGEIDLTGIEEPETNKMDFNWGSVHGGNGKADIDGIVQKIWNRIQNILDFIVAEESNTSNEVPMADNTVKPEQIKQKMETNLKSVIDVTMRTDGADVVAEFINDKKVKFEINHAQLEENSNPFTTIYKSYEKKIIINVNVNHFLWKNFLFADNVESRNVKSNLLYPLAICFAVCKLKYDAKDDPEFIGDDILDTKSFDEFFSDVLTRLRTKR